MPCEENCLGQLQNSHLGDAISALMVMHVDYVFWPCNFVHSYTINLAAEPIDDLDVFRCDQVQQAQKEALRSTNLVHSIEQRVTQLDNEAVMVPNELQANRTKVPDEGSRSMGNCMLALRRGVSSIDRFCHR